MRICFYAPFKPLYHPNPSGDLIIATGLFDFLQKQGHELLIASTLRSRWIYWKPWLFPILLKERIATRKRVRDFAPDIWLTYHSYYKSPDLLGPGICREMNIPYTLFQAIYSTKRQRKLTTAPGFYLNRRALLAAGHLFTNRENDLENLRRIISSDKLSYIKPGIFPEQFLFNKEARLQMHKKWDSGKSIVILSAAMFRPDVKTEGLIWLIKTLASLANTTSRPFKLVIAGDGSERRIIEKMAARHLPGCVIFAGKIERKQMYRFYSGGDIFAFPGIRESLGMVFLEAQSCGLPVVAFDNGGIPEVVQKNTTAFLTKAFAEDKFRIAINQLLQDAEQRHIMGNAAAKYVRKHHDLKKNYLHFETLLINHAQPIIQAQ